MAMSGRAVTPAMEELCELAAQLNGDPIAVQEITFTYRARFGLCGSLAVKPPYSRNRHIRSGWRATTDEVVADLRTQVDRLLALRT